MHLHRRCNNSNNCCSPQLHRRLLLSCQPAIMRRTTKVCDTIIELMKVKFLPLLQCLLQYFIYLQQAQRHGTTCSTELLLRHRYHQDPRAQGHIGHRQPFLRSRHQLHVSLHPRETLCSSSSNRQRQCLRYHLPFLLRDRLKDRLKMPLAHPSRIICTKIR